MSHVTFFFVSLGLYALVFAISLRAEARSRAFLLIALPAPLLFAGLSLGALIRASGHLPTHFLFERFLQLGLWVGILLWLDALRGRAKEVAPYILLLIVVLYGVASLFPKGITPPVYRYALPLAKLFFELEAWSFALLTVSSAWYLRSLVESRRQGNEPRDALQQGRRYLLFGFVLFLASQFFGSLWSLQGWGDYWMWGKMSAVGVVVWFYLMFVLHARYVPACGRVFESTAGFLVFALTIAYRMAWQP